MPALNRSPRPMDPPVSERASVPSKSAKKPAIDRPLTAEDYQALGAFREALRRFLAFSEASSAEEGLTPQQHQAILAIHVHPGKEAMSVGELADSLGVKNHSAVGLVGRLIARGLVTRAPAPGDRRRVLLKLTPSAKHCLEAISRRNLGELKTQAQAFTDLLSTLKRLERGA